MLPRRWTRRRALLTGLVLAGLLVGIPAAVGVNTVPLTGDHTLAPAPEVPATVGDVTFAPVPETEEDFAERRDRSLVGALEFFTVERKGSAVGTLQTAAFKSGLADDNIDVRAGLLRAMGMTDVQRVGSEIYYTRRLGDLQIAVWFSRDGQTYQVLTTGGQVRQPLSLFAQLVATQSGLPFDEVTKIKDVPPSDARMGSYR